MTETNGDTQPNPDPDNTASTDDDNQQPNSEDETSTTEEVTPADVSDDTDYEYNAEKMGMTPVVRSSDNESSESAESADDGDSGNAD